MLVLAALTLSAGGAAAQSRSLDPQDQAPTAPDGAQIPPSAGSTIAPGDLDDDTSPSPGVIQPPTTGDRSVVPPPSTGPQSTPVIPLPGSPGGNRSVEPK
jgi:hypothetical protein